MPGRIPAMGAVGTVTTSLLVVAVACILLALLDRKDDDDEDDDAPPRDWRAMPWRSLEKVEGV